MQMEKLTAIAAVGLMLVIAASAQAYQVTMEMGGTITSVDDPANGLPDLEVGDSWSYTYTFESTEPDLNPDPGQGTYSLSSITCEVDGVVYPMRVSSSDHRVAVSPDLGSQGDTYHVQTDLEFGSYPGYGDPRSYIILTEPSVSVFADDSLLLAPLDLQLFGHNVFRLIGSPAGYGSLLVYGTATYWTPEPSSLLLLIAGLPLLRRRRSC